MLWKCYTQYLENSAVATGLEKSIVIPIPKKGNAKECSNYRTIALISHTSYIMFRVLQARFQQYVNHELPDVQACFRRSRGTEIKLPTSAGSSKKQESSRKTSTSALLIMPKYWLCRLCDCVDHNKLWKILKEKGIQTTWPASWEICMQVKKQQLEPDMEQQTGSKLGKEYVKAVCCYPAYLRVHHEKCQAGRRTSWKQYCWEKYQ